MYSNAIYLRKALESGVSGYVLKSGASEELLKAIKTVLNGGTWVSPGFAPNVVESARAPHRLNRIDLTDRQRQILQLIAEGRPTKEIADILCLSVRTVEFHRYRLMEKLGTRTVADLTRFAIEEGLTGTSQQ
jgi:DNA-binding NarL/FixJ family response regulator